MQTSTEDFQKIRDLLVTSKIDIAIEMLINIVKDNEQYDKLHHIQLNLRQHNENKQNFSKGIVSQEDYQITLNKITLSLLDVIKGLTSSQRKKKKSSSKKLVKDMTESDLMRITKAAIVVIEFEKIKEQFEETDNWEEKNKALRKLFKFEKHVTVDITKDIFLFLEDVASIARAGLTGECSHTIDSLIIHFFPYHGGKISKKNFKHLTRQAAQIGKYLVYDAAMYLQDLKVVVSGLTILKWAYHKALDRKIPKTASKILEEYQWLEESIYYPEQQITVYAKEMIDLFKKDVHNKGLKYPRLPKYLNDLI